MHDFLRLLAIPILANAVAADDFYVDGKTGKDLPTHGSSVAMPWKSIAFALSRIPTASSTATHTLHVAGGQVYSAATNGESYPLAPGAGVAIVGIVGIGTRPVLAIPNKGTGLLFDSKTTFDRRSRLANLAFVGGDRGVVMSVWDARHGPVIVDCAFRGHAGTAVGVSVTTPTL